MRGLTPRVAHRPAAAAALRPWLLVAVLSATAGPAGTRATPARGGGGGGGAGGRPLPAVATGSAPPWERRGTPRGTGGGFVAVPLQVAPARPRVQALGPSRMLLCTQVRNQSRNYVVEWIEFHRLQVTATTLQRCNAATLQRCTYSTAARCRLRPPPAARRPPPAARRTSPPVAQQRATPRPRRRVYAAQPGYLRDPHASRPSCRVCAEAAHAPAAGV